MYHSIDFWDITVPIIRSIYTEFITCRKNTSQIQLLATPYDYVDVSRQEHVNNRHFLSKMLFRVLLANT